MTRALSSILCLVALAACADSDPVTVVFVTVDRRAGVTDLAQLEVRVDNDSANISDAFDVSGRSFPITFTITPQGRQGPLNIAVVALDANGIERARGSTSTAIAVLQQVDASVLLDPSDFVVNSKISGNQRLNFTTEDNGKQLALNLADGSFAVVFEDDCGMLSRCDVFMRLYDADGTPRTNQVNQDDTAFIVNLTSEGFRLGPAVAWNNGSYFVVWEAENAVNGVIVTNDGMHLQTSEVVISDGAMTPTSVHVAALGNGGFVVTWSEWSQTKFGNVIRGRLFNSMGVPLPNPITNDDTPFGVSIDETIDVTGPSVVGTGADRAFVVVWRDNENVFARFFDGSAVPMTAAPIRLTNHTATAAVLAPHVTWSAGQAVVTWTVIDSSVPALVDGVLQIAQFAGPSGTRVTPVVTLATANAEFFSLVSPAVAVRPDGLLAASWHNCGAQGDGDDCGIALQLLRASGLPIGGPQIINTTKRSGQVGPSIVARDDALVGAWTDRSQHAPDTSNDAVRARVLFIDAALNNGTLGSRCGRTQDSACEAGLVCIAGSEAVPYCHSECEPTAAPPQCPSGGVCTTVGDASGCVF